MKQGVASVKGIVACWLLAASATAWAQTSQRAGPATARSAVTSESATLSAGDAAITIDGRTGTATAIRVGGGQLLTQPHPAGSEMPAGYVEVTDLRDGRRYSPGRAESAVTDWKVTGQGPAQQLRFTQQFAQAPFRIEHTLSCGQPVKGPQTQSATADKTIRWEVSLRLLDGQKENRSVVVSWLLPLPMDWQFWGPNDVVSRPTNGVIPYRYVYGHTDPSACSVLVPLVGVWNNKGGAAIFCPPDLHKPQVIFDVYTQDISDPARGIFRAAADLQMLRISHHLVGLRPGKELKLAVCLAGCGGNWRSAMAQYAGAYPELFEPVPATRKYEGMYGIVSMSQLTTGEIDGLAAQRPTCVEVHGHFQEYGYYISPESLKDPTRQWVYQSRPGGKMSLESNRKMVDLMQAKGMGAFIYYYNVHANPETGKKLFPDDGMVSELGKPLIQWDDEPALRGWPDSAFGKNLLEQLGLLIRAYPQAAGFFVDNYSIQMLDFAHDDGVSMVHNKPCYDLNLNHQLTGTASHELAHKAGKVMMVNKLSTIESARGVDMVLLEGGSVDMLKSMAFACLYRPMFPLGWEGARGRTRGLRAPGGRGADFAEKCLQQLLIWGGTPYTQLGGRSNQDTLKAYRPLTDCMIGRRWILDADNPLDLPAPCQGQIFRIDATAPHAGDVVVSVVNLDRSWREPPALTDKTITIRLEGNPARQGDAVASPAFVAATWLAVEKSAEPPVPCPITREGGDLKVTIPAIGAAGILRLGK